MRPGDAARARKLTNALKSYASGVRPLPGVEDERSRAALVEQMIESIRRIEYVRALLQRELDGSSATPGGLHFDPLKAAVVSSRKGLHDEACWFVFLFVHFGKHVRTGYQLAREVYAGGKTPKPWTWERVSGDPARFRAWLVKVAPALRTGGAKFGNHRKYESLKDTANGTGGVVQSYVDWVGPSRSHKARFDTVLKACGSDPGKSFDSLYRSLTSVKRFGRTARFDYLTMLGKLNLAAIEPSVAYLQGAGAGEATGPLRGARLLFGGSVAAELRASVLDSHVVELGKHLRVGMQVMEDSLCNWQKSPTKFRPFRG